MNTRTAPWIGVYLAAIVAANLIITEYGPQASIYTAMVLIGLDITVRDRLHEQWADRLALRMGALIVAGSALSYLVQADAGRIALASAVAFGAALTVDALVFHRLRSTDRVTRWNGSNVASAAVDSILFPTLAFGAWMPEISMGQFAAKVAGGLIWTWVILAIVRRRTAPASAW